MNRAAAWVPGLAGLLAACWLFCVGCGKEKPKPPLPAPTANAAGRCVSGVSLDPTHQQARPAIQALRAKDYATALRLFGELAAKYPESASLRVWRGDALLGQGLDDAAVAALSAYAEARALDARGCKLRERERYFLAVGTADAELRQARVVDALGTLTKATQEWPDNPELLYQRARAECLQGQRDECFEDLKAALLRSRHGSRPRFSRGHRASEQLQTRAKTQPEFADLRKESRYELLLASLVQTDAGELAP